MDQQKAEIRQALDWIFAAKFNFISTEAGSTEFTHPGCTVMLAWMNYVTQYVCMAQRGKGSSFSSSSSLCFFFFFLFGFQCYLFLFDAK
jgi:hypothetical protein